MNHIYIIGFMGTGKTTVGKALCAQMGREFVDLDDMIEQKESAKISDIFAQKGESYFRKLEKEALAEVSKKKNLIVACGGGIVLDEDNINLMKKTGTLICLHALAQTVLDRTKGYLHRPLLNVSDPKEKIEELLVLRAPFYAKADYTVDTSELNVEGVVGKILKIVKSGEQREND